MLAGAKNISPQDMDLIKIVDDADDAVAEIVNFYKDTDLRPNF
jgi:hypothetical protein